MFLALDDAMKTYESGNVKVSHTLLEEKLRFRHEADNV
jgi:hypothetical protein